MKSNVRNQLTSLFKLGNEIWIFHLLLKAGQDSRNDEESSRAELKKSFRNTITLLILSIGIFLLSTPDKASGACHCRDKSKSSTR